MYKNPEERQKYWQEWYSVPENRRKHIKRNRAQEAKHRIEIKKWADDYKIKKGCIDCGYRTNAVALDFDHVKGKRANVSLMIRNFNSLKAVQLEITKCEVRCANCHRIKHLSK